MKKINHLKISLKHNTDKIEIPEWTKVINVIADSTEDQSDKKMNEVYKLFAKTLGMTDDEVRKKYSLRFYFRFNRPYTENYVEFFDSVVNLSKHKF